MKRTKAGGAASLLLCAVVLLGAGTIYQTQRADAYQTQLTHTQSRAFYELVDSVKKLDATLEKGLHASTDGYYATLSGQIYANAAAAKAAVGQLTLSDTNLERTEKFLSQVGDYSLSLAKQHTKGQATTQEQYDVLESLSQYAKELSTKLIDMEEQLSLGNVSIGSLSETMEGTQASLLDSFTGAEEDFAEYPSLLYDGPYSDHMEQRTALYLEGGCDTTIEDCLESAAQLLGCSPKEVTGTAGNEGTVPTWRFTAQNGGVAEFTCVGGVPMSLSLSRTIGPPKLSAEEGVAAAKEYLSALGFGETRETYWNITDGLLLVNFASVEDGYLCYPDLIELGVALDTGDVIYFNAKGFVMCHTDRQFDPPAVTAAEVQSKLSARLTVKEQSLCVIPDDAGAETAVYAFICTNQDGRQYLVCFNTQTGAEEDIMILVEGDDGTLAL